MHFFRPDLIIADYHDTIRIAADAEGLPIIGVAMATGTRTGLELGFWKSDEAADREMPNCLEAFNSVRSGLRLSPYLDERDPFTGDLTLIPSCGALDPVAPGNPTLHVGPISGPKQTFKTSGTEKPLIVSYLAEGNARPPDQFAEQLFLAINRLRKSFEFRIFGDFRYQAVFGEPGPDNEYRGLVPPSQFDECISQASVLITAGGASLAHALQFGVPTLCLPWTSSESAWSWRVNAMRAGILPPPYFAPLEWRYDEAVGCMVAGHWDLPYTVDDLCGWITNLVEDKDYKYAASKLSAELRRAAEVLPATLDSLLDPAWVKVSS